MRVRMRMLAISRHHFTPAMLEQLSPGEAQRMREDRAMHVVCKALNQMRHTSLVQAFDRWRHVAEYLSNNAMVSAATRIQVSKRFLCWVG